MSALKQLKDKAEKDGQKKKEETIFSCIEAPGKNTMMKRSIRLHAEKIGNPDLLRLEQLLVGNVGLIFTKGDLREVREEIAKYKIVE